MFRAEIRLGPRPRPRSRVVGGLLMTVMTRRHLLTAAGATVAGAMDVHAQTTTDKTLIGAAKPKNLIYGAAVANWQIDRDVALRRTFDRQCSTVVPEWEMKWGTIEATLG